MIALDGLAGDLANLAPDDAADLLGDIVADLERPHRRTGRYLANIRRGEPINGTVSQLVAGAPYSPFVEANRAPLAAAVRIGSGKATSTVEQAIAQRIRKRFPS